MSKVSISEAIRMVGVSRSHFYKKYINKGVISITIEQDKKLIDVAELIRVFGSVQIEDVFQEQKRTNGDSENTSEKTKIIAMLEQQLAELKQREKDAQEREIWLKSQIDELRLQQTYFLENKQKRKKFLWIF